MLDAYFNATTGQLAMTWWSLTILVVGIVLAIGLVGATTAESIRSLAGKTTIIRIDVPGSARTNDGESPPDGSGLLPRGRGS